MKTTVTAFLLTLALCLCHAGPLPAQADAGSRAWPGFRGNGNSISGASNLPLKWPDTENLKWKLDLPGYGQSSPVIWGDLVAVTSVEGEMKETLVVTAVSLESGKVLWEKRFEGTQKIESSKMVSRGAPTPAIDGDGLYLFFESGDLVGLDHAGELLWQRSLVTEYGPFKGGHGIGSSLAQTDDALIVLVDHDGPSYLLKVDKATGKNLWKVDREPRMSWSSPIVAAAGPTGKGGGEILISSNGVAEAYSVADGTLLWRMDGIEKNTVASPTVAEDGTVLIGSSEPRESMAIAPPNPEVGQDSQATMRWSAGSTTSSFGSPLLYRGLAYFVNSSGVVSCHDAESGELLWEERLSASTWASPLGAGDRVYFFSKDGGCTVFRAGSALAEKLATNTLEIGPEATVYGVAAVDAHLVLRTGTALYCVAAPARKH